MTGTVSIARSITALEAFVVGVGPPGQSRSIAAVAGVGEVLGGAIGLLVVGGALATLLLVARRSLGDDGRADADDPVETLKRRYVDGAIDELEFERRLEVLYEDETATDGGTTAETTASAPGTAREKRVTERDTEERSPEKAPEERSQKGDTRSRRSPKKRGCHSTGGRRCG